MHFSISDGLGVTVKVEADVTTGSHYEFFTVHRRDGAASRSVSGAETGTHQVGSTAPVIGYLDQDERIGDEARFEKRHREARRGRQQHEEAHSEKITR